MSAIDGADQPRFWSRINFNTWCHTSAFPVEDGAIGADSQSLVMTSPLPKTTRGAYEFGRAVQGGSHLKRRIFSLLIRYFANSYHLILSSGRCQQSSSA